MQQPVTAAGPPSATQVSLLPVLSDNYVFVLHGAGSEPGAAAVIDPAVAAPVIAWLEQRGLSLTAILHTHHHSDHIGGAAELLQRWPQAEVIASRADRARIPLQTRGVADGEQFSLLGREVRVLAVPGHTAHHIAFHLPASAGGQEELFCGDTLFSGGCGRLFEGSPEQMQQSLQKLAQLPDVTRVWCAHEYTEANLRWATAEEPQDNAIAARLAQVQELRRQHRPSLPSSIGVERRTNLFMRCRDGAELRRRRGSKDLWKG